MENIKKIKQNLKSCTKKQEFLNLKNCSINFENLDKNSDLKTTKLTRIQYLSSSFLNLKTRKEIKFPLETVAFISPVEFIKHLSENKKNKLGVNKLNSIVTFETKMFKNVQINDEPAYSQIKQDMNNFIKPISFFNLNNSEKNKI